MSSFLLNNSGLDFTPINNIFIDKYMTKARGEFVKVYILLLKRSINGEHGVSSSILAASLNLLESEVDSALKYWNDEGVIKLSPIDKMNNFKLEFVNLSDTEELKSDKLDLLSALDKKNTKEMLKEIEQLLGRTLSSKEMITYLSWESELNFSLELILFLIEYCVSKNKKSASYIEKVALAWHDAGIKTIEDANKQIANSEDKWIKIRSILNYLGIKNNEIMKPQQDMIEKWLFEYNFSVDVIFRACKICSDKLNRADLKYIDGILNKWRESGFKTLEDITAKDSIKQPRSKAKSPKPSTGKTLRFTNYDQRDYDYDALENELLGWDN